MAQFLEHWMLGTLTKQNILPEPVTLVTNKASLISTDNSSQPKVLLNESVAQYGWEISPETNSDDKTT